MNINTLVGDYLVECCMRYELACPQMNEEEFSRLATKLLDNWAMIEHPQKGLVHWSNLCSGPDGRYIIFPSIVRHVACRRASKLLDNPVAGWSEQQITDYCTSCQGKNFNR